MSIDLNGKLLIIHGLQRARHLGEELALRLKLQGRPAEAAQLELEADELTQTIDALTTQNADQWPGDTLTVLKRLDTAERGLREAIEGVQRLHDVSSNVAKALGKLDDIIAIGRDSLG